MRILLLFLFSLPVYAQLYTGSGADGDCTDAMIAAGGDFDCEKLEITATPTFLLNTQRLVIRVRGNVLISAPLDLSGAGGADINVNGTDGGRGGPGAGNGGGLDAGGNPTPQHLLATSASLGRGAGGTTDCGEGGGGGGMAIDGDDGRICPPNPNLAAIKGLTVDPSEFSFSGNFRGGFGGGAGGISSTGWVGSGGGGGGAIHIIAGGTVTINANVDADGGAGGSNITGDGGGGGGGSGGVIWIQTNGQIINNASIDADAGAGGDGGDLGAGDTAGDGGNGAHGFVRLEDADGIIGGDVASYGTKLITPALSNSQSLESGISCGMIKPKDNQNVFQIAFGFAFILLMSSMIKILSRFRLKT